MRKGNASANKPAKKQLGPREGFLSGPAAARYTDVWNRVPPAPCGQAGRESRENLRRIVKDGLDAVFIELAGGEGVVRFHRLADP